MILVLDDEPESVDLLVEELEEAGLPVTYATAADEAIEIIENSGESIEIAIVDIMLPPGDSFSRLETSDGLTTGVLVVERLRCRNTVCPIFLLTNLRAAQVVGLSESDPRIFLRIKTNVFYDDFADEIKEAYHALRTDSDE